MLILPTCVIYPADDFGDFAPMVDLFQSYSRTKATSFCLRTEVCLEAA
jgi:hypothetical protein